MTALVPKSTQNLAITDSMNTAMRLLIDSLSETSKRQYQHTFKTWIEYAHQNKFHPLDLKPDNVLSFLNAGDLSKTTKQARLTHLRKLAQALHFGYIANIGFEQNYKQLQMISVKDGNGKQRDKKALTPKEVTDAFAKCAGDDLQSIRNRALLAILFYAGLRRAEIVNLKWSDLDLTEGLITLPHRKHKENVSTIPFASDSAIEYLQEWYKASNGENRTYVFSRISWSGKTISDEPMTTDAIRKITKEIGSFSPHSARRTLITRGLAKGSSVADMQFIAGHKNPQTTLGYAQVKDAKEVKGRVKLDY